MDAIASDNVTEIRTSNFDLVVPANTQMPNLPPGTWDAGSHGWWAFLCSVCQRPRQRR